MEQRKILKKVTTPTDWVSSLVITKKQKTDKLRICIDPRDLNKAIRRPHLQMPTIEDMLPDFNNAKVFTTMDAKDGFW